MCKNFIGDINITQVLILLINIKLNIFMVKSPLYTLAVYLIQTS